jgi:hypothetical protein
MRRTLVVVALFISVLWQVAAVPRHVPLPAGDSGATDWVLHWQERAHHHEDDGQITQDESGESVLHVAEDNDLDTPVLPVVSRKIGPCPPDNVQPMSTPADSLPAPYLEGLLRPPIRGA